MNEAALIAGIVLVTIIVSGFVIALDRRLDARTCVKCRAGRDSSIHHPADHCYVDGRLCRYPAEHHRFV